MCFKKRKTKEVLQPKSREAVTPAGRPNVVNKLTVKQPVKSEPSTTPVAPDPVPPKKDPEPAKREEEKPAPPAVTKAKSEKKKKEKVEETPVMSATQHTKKLEKSLKLQKTQNSEEMSTDKVEEDTLDNVDKEMPVYSAENDERSQFGEKNEQILSLMEQRLRVFGKL